MLSIKSCTYQSTQKLQRSNCEGFSEVIAASYIFVHQDSRKRHIEVLELRDLDGFIVFGPPSARE